jgi:hypothetical protein
MLNLRIRPVDTLIEDTVTKMSNLRAYTYRLTYFYCKISNFPENNKQRSLDAGYGRKVSLIWIGKKCFIDSGGPIGWSLCAPEELGLYLIRVFFVSLVYLVVSTHVTTNEH